MDMFNNINTAPQNVQTNTTDFKPHRISDLIPINWEGSKEKGQFRSFMSHLHLWMQIWSDQGERILARVESVDKVDRATLAVDCTEADFRTFHEPLKKVQQMKRTERSWGMALDRQETRSDKHVLHAFNVCSADQQHHRKGQSERRGWVPEDFHDWNDQVWEPIWQDQGRGEGARNQEIDARELAELQVQKNGSAVRWTYHYAGEHHHWQRTNSPHIQKQETWRQRPNGVWNSNERRWRECKPRRRPSNRRPRSAYKPSTKGLAKANGGFRKSQSWNEKSSKGSKGGGKNSWQKGNGKKGSKGARGSGKGKTRTCWTCGTTKNIAAWCKKRSNKNLYATDEDDSKNVEELAEDENNLQAWCLLEENENEQWQEVMSRRNKQRVKRANQASLLWRAIKVWIRKRSWRWDKWAKVRVTMDSGAAGHVIPETMFPRVKLERRTSPKKFVATNGKQIKDLGDKNIPFKTNEGIQRCTVVSFSQPCHAHLTTFPTHTALPATPSANTRRRMFVKSEPMAITTQEAVDGYPEMAISRECRTDRVG